MFDVQEIIALIIVFACALNLARMFYHSFSGSGKSSHCGGCPSGCGKIDKPVQIKSFK